MVYFNLVRGYWKKKPSELSYLQESGFHQLMHIPQMMIQKDLVSYLETISFTWNGTTVRQQQNYCILFWKMITMTSALKTQKKVKSQLLSYINANSSFISPKPKIWYLILFLFSKLHQGNELIKEAISFIWIIVTCSLKF